MLDCTIGYLFLQLSSRSRHVTMRELPMSIAVPSYSTTAPRLENCAARFRTSICQHMLTPVAVRSKAWVCGRSLAGNVDSNPAGDMDVCLL